MREAIVLVGAVILAACSKRHDPRASTAPVPSAAVVVAPSSAPPELKAAVDAGVELVVYANPRFDFSVLVPSDLEAQEEPTNGDGREFKSHDGQVREIAWGMWLFDATNFEEDYQDALKPSKERPTVSYHARGPDWFVVSGRTKDGRIFYAKRIRYPLGEGVAIAEVELSYPETRRATYDAIAGRVAGSFAH
jgi:hypothetical protein